MGVELLPAEKMAILVGSAPGNVLRVQAWAPNTEFPGFKPSGVGRAQVPLLPPSATYH